MVYLTGKKIKPVKCRYKVKYFGAERKKKKIKRTILKEVLEENIRITKKAEYKKPRKKIKPGKIAVIAFSSFLIIFIFAFFNNFASIKSSLFQHKRFGFLKSKVASQPSAPELSETGTKGNSLTPSHYNTFLNESVMPLRRIFGLKVKKIVIDPGHGGEDAGAVGKLGTKEKDITLDIAKMLRDRLRKDYKYQVVLTRENDITLSLKERIEFADSYGADIFISIHVNYIPNKPLDIIETYYFGPYKDKRSLLLAERENQGTEYTVKDFKKIIRNIENTLKTQESHSLAQLIQKSLYGNISKQNKNVKNWGIKTAPFVVLLGVGVPSVLTEVTCLSNADEENKLNKKYYREKIARYLEEGIVSYLNKNIDKGDVIWNKKSPVIKKMIYSSGLISVHPAVPL